MLNQIDVFWLLVTALSSGLFARLSKRFPALPKSAVPWIALLSGSLFMLVKTWQIDGMPLWPEAVEAALQGTGAGAVAVGGHEALKPLLVRLFGDKAATTILGKLPTGKAPAKEDDQPPKSEVAKNSAASLLVMIALASLVAVAAPLAVSTGCATLAKLLPVLAKVAPVLSKVSTFLKIVEASGADWFAEHPDADAEQAFTRELTRAQGALAIVETSTDRDEIDHAFGDLKASYGHLYKQASETPGFLEAAKVLGSADGADGEGLVTPDAFDAEISQAYGE